MFRYVLWLRVLLGILAGLVAVPSPAEAAMKVCEAQVEGEGREGVTEVEAKAAALTSWLEKAGPGKTWPLATNKGIVCAKTPKGTFVCRALGRPCVLHQQPPKGPFKRLMPDAPGEKI